jgi:hypothetical protein
MPRAKPAGAALLDNVTDIWRIKIPTHAATITKATTRLRILRRLDGGLDALLGFSIIALYTRTMFSHPSASRIFAGTHPAIHPASPGIFDLFRA